jgi:hypothetical protein
MGDRHSRDCAQGARKPIGNIGCPPRDPVLDRLEATGEDNQKYDDQLRATIGTERVREDRADAQVRHEVLEIFRCARPDLQIPGNDREKYD